jgi:hypothetical protein
MKTLLEFLGSVFIFIGISSALLALLGLIVEMIGPTPDRFGLVFVVSCGPIGIVFLLLGRFFWRRSKKIVNNK